MNRKDRKTFEEEQSTDSDFENLGTGELLSVQSYTPADKSTATILADPQPSKASAQSAPLHLPITPPPP
ncbi:hypothetical protein IFM47457_11128 [Aspergillus lentulus]|nr:hypothetical protein IFM47457_11128 [Aspergillus lentulus]